MTEDNKNTEKQCDIHVVIERLEKLQKWYPSTGDCGPFAGSIDWDEDNDGDWIRLEDVEDLIKELKLNAL